MKTAKDDADKQQILIRLDVNYNLVDGKTIVEATEVAKKLVESARDLGTVTGHLIVGRQKFRIPG